MILRTKLELLPKKCLFLQNNRPILIHILKATYCGKGDNKGNERKLPEPPTNCCMKGCANCVWIEYAETLREFFVDGGKTAIKEIHEKVQDENIKAFILHELRMRNIK